MSLRVHTIWGTSALSTFRLEQLLARAQAQDITVTGLSAQYLYVYESEANLSADSWDSLNSLLNETEMVLAGLATHFVTSPRIGTISPWSSKATDIVQNCGLTQVKRIERAIAWQVEGDLSGEQIQMLQALVHDRMTESVLSSVDDLSALF